MSMQSYMKFDSAAVNSGTRVYLGNTYLNYNATTSGSVIGYNNSIHIGSANRIHMERFGVPPIIDSKRIFAYVNYRNTEDSPSVSIGFGSDEYSTEDAYALPIYEFTPNGMIYEDGTVHTKGYRLVFAPNMTVDLLQMDERLIGETGDTYYLDLMIVEHSEATIDKYESVHLNSSKCRLLYPIHDNQAAILRERDRRALSDYPAFKRRILLDQSVSL